MITTIGAARPLDRITRITPSMNAYCFDGYSRSRPHVTASSVAFFPQRSDGMRSSKDLAVRAE